MERLFGRDVIVIFFFFEDVNNHPVIKEAFRQICANKLLSDMYCDMEEYIAGRIEKNTVLTLLKADSPVAQLYQEAYPSLENANSLWGEFEEKYQTVHSLSFIEAKALVNWIYRAYPKMEQRKDVTAAILPSISEMFSIDTLAFADSIIYVKAKVEINMITSFTGFYKLMQDIDSPGRTVYYRGHADTEYILLPSVMRTDNWQSHERDMYNELIIECPKDFSHCTKHIDYLVHMQHYGLPTRLLDISRNPLVALFFACESNPGKRGEVIVFDVDSEKIKYPGSDTVTVLASLPLFKKELQNDFFKWAADAAVSQADFNKKAKRLLHEVKLEKPAFKDEIMKNDILDCFFVLSEKKNDRIIKQDGAFIICGLIDKEKNPIHNDRYANQGKIQIFIIESKSKKEILKMLNKFSINSASLFPEISDVTGFIKGKY